MPTEPGTRRSPRMLLVSVVVPAYNAERTIGATLESALHQTHRETEIIVVDDGSTDGTAGVVAAFGERIRYLRQPNAGAAAARNTGIAAARGEFVALLDADDLWLPQKLEQQLAYFDAHPEVGAVQCGARFVDNALRTLEIRPCVTGGDALWDVVHFRNLPAFLSALVVRRSCLDRNGAFDTSLAILEEWDMAIKTARYCGLASIAEPLVLYRVHAGNRSRDVDLHVAPGLRVLDRLFADPNLPSRLRDARPQIYGTFYRMLAGGYFRARRPMPFLSWAVRALVSDPAQIIYMSALPVRVVRRRMSRD